jgi:ABC-2 type transport system permease protein
MVSPALMRKTFRDYLLLWAGLLALLVAVLVLFMLAIHSGVFDQKQDFLKVPFVRRFMTIMIGSDPLTYMSPTAITAFGFTHPLVWALLIIFAISMGSGVLAGEMDRGTMDLVATLPISRGRIYASHSAMLLAMGLVMCWGVWVGVAIGRRILGVYDVRLDLLVRVTWNLYAVYVLIASFSLAISAMTSRRGPAVAAAFFLVFYAFVLNVLRAIWPKLDALAWSDFLYYYQSLRIIWDEGYRWKDFAVLLSMAAAWWIVGYVAFSRRDIPAR